MSIVYAVPSRIRDPPTSVIIAHGAGGPMYSPFIRYFHTEIAKQGFLSVKFNFPYTEARRKVPDRNDVLETSYRAVVSEVSNGNHKMSRMFIGGKSMGGRIASQIVAKGGTGVDGLFFLGYPLHPPGKLDQLRDSHLYRIRKPMIFVSGTRDSFARKDLLKKVVERIGANASLNWIEDGDHSFKTHGSVPKDSTGTEQALAILLEWLEKMA